MKKYFFIGCLFFAVTSSAQTSATIAVMDFVKIKNNHKAEVIYYYENNWKVYRDIAIKKNYISSYRLLTVQTDSLANFDIILVTEYTDSVQLKSSEERFQGIIKSVRPNGPILLNALKPNEFRQNVFAKEAGTLFYSKNEVQ